MTLHPFLIKKGQCNGYNGFKRITGTKIHAAVESNGFPISILLSPANEHDSTKCIDVIESISDYLDDDSIQQIESVYADKVYDAKYIRMYLWDRNIACCIPYKINSKFILQNNDYKHYNKTRFVVERFFAWLKNGFHRTRTRYERTAENYLAFVNPASFLMYCRVLR